MPKGKKDSGKKAMFAEAKVLESKGKKQKAGVPTDEAPEMPTKMAKGPAALKGRDFRGMKDGKKDSGPFGKSKEIPKKAHKKVK